MAYSKTLLNKLVTFEVTKMQKRNYKTYQVHYHNKYFGERLLNLKTFIERCVFFNVSLVRICFVYVYSVVRDLIKEASGTNRVLRTLSLWGPPGDST